MFYDSLAHPTLNGKWINGDGDSFASFVALIEREKLKGACVCGLPGVGQYEHKSFFDASKIDRRLFPIASLTKTSISKIVKELNYVKKIGYRAIKIHPRFLGIFFSAEQLEEIFTHCSRLNLIVYYCSYYHSSIDSMPFEDPYWELVKAIKNSPNIKLVIVHGGGVRLLEYCELARFSDNILIDLSLTLMKYDGSSIDKDIQFLFKHFDRKIVVGSDHPEWEIMSLKKKIKKLLKGISFEKKNNILFKNIISFLGI